MYSTHHHLTAMACAAPSRASKFLLAAQRYRGTEERSHELIRLSAQLMSSRADDFAPAAAAAAVPRGAARGLWPCRWCYDAAQGHSAGYALGVPNPPRLQREGRGGHSGHGSTAMVHAGGSPVATRSQRASLQCGDLGLSAEHGQKKQAGGPGPVLGPPGRGQGCCEAVRGPGTAPAPAGGALQQGQPPAPQSLQEGPGGSVGHGPIAQGE